MPIYAYRCTSCGHAQDVLQKMSDPLLSVCPACGAAAFTKQLTAAGFQLKGSGWYVTDFRGGNSAGAKKDDEQADKPAETTAADAKPADQAAEKPAAKPSDAPSDKPAQKPADKPAPKAADKPAAAPAAAAPASGS